MQIGLGFGASGIAAIALFGLGVQKLKQSSDGDGASDIYPDYSSGGTAQPSSTGPPSPVPALAYGGPIVEPSPPIRDGEDLNDDDGTGTEVDREGNDDEPGDDPTSMRTPIG